MRITSSSISIRRPFSHLFAWLHRWLASFLGITRQKNNIASLDGVRGIACLTVIFYHINLITYHAHIWSSHDVLTTSIALAGASGVTLFFVLSGFLLFRPYAQAFLVKSEKSKWPSTRRFYLRRFFRIVPAYYASLLLMIIFIHPEYLSLNHLTDLALFFTLFMDSSQTTYRAINGPFWTLAVEWQFYLLLPLLALGIGWLARAGKTIEGRFVRATCGLLLLIIWGVSSRYIGMYFTGSPSATLFVPRSVINVFLFFTYGMLGKFLEDFAVGMFVSLCFVFVQNIARDHVFTRWIRRVSSWLWAVGLALLLFMALWLGNQILLPHSLPLIETITGGLYRDFMSLDEIGLALGYGLCVAAILFGPPLFRRPFESTILRWLGLISYSLYIWHLILILAFHDNILPFFAGLNPALVYSLYWLWVVLAVIPFAFMFFVLIERPGMKVGEWVMGGRVP